MAHYVWNEGTAQGAALRALLNSLDSVLHNAATLNDLLNQMSNAQVHAMFSFSDGVAAADDTTAGTAKSELLSDLGKLLTDASQTNVISGLKQLLAQFG